MARSTFRLLVAASALTLIGCSSDNSSSVQGTGGSKGSGGTPLGTGGTGSGGQGSGGQGSGGTGNGGQGSGGTPLGTGGTGSGGQGTGGKTGSGGTTGTATGGTSGIAAGGTTGGGSGGKMGNGGVTGTAGATGIAGNTGDGGIAAGGITGGGGTGPGGKTGAGGTTGGGGTGPGGRTGAGGTTGGGGTTSTGAKLHAFMLLGQSNMAGYAKAQDSDKENSPRIRVIGFDDCSATGRKKDEWADAAPPLHECWNSAVGPGDSFSKTLLDKIPAGDSILLVPCALSGKSINDMKKGTSNYTWFISRAKSAQQLGAVIEGLLFHQGESDCGQSTWPAAVKQFVTDLRTDLNLGDTVPFLAGELPPDSACSQHNTLVDQLPSQITNAFVVSSSGLKLDPADTQYHMHFGHDDTVEMGKRYEAKLVDALKW